MKKITAVEEDLNKCLSIWLADFDDMDDLQNHAHEVLLPHFDEEDGVFLFDDIMEASVNGSPSPIEKLVDDLLWQVCDAKAVAARAAELGIEEATSMYLLNHARCSATPHEFPGFVFLGTFPSHANPNAPKDEDEEYDD